MNTELIKERIKSFTPIEAGWTFKGLVSNDDGSITVSSLPIIGVTVVEAKFKRDKEVQDALEFVVVDGGQPQTQSDVHQEWYEGLNTYPIGVYPPGADINGGDRHVNYCKGELAKKMEKYPNLKIIAA